MKTTTTRQPSLPEIKQAIRVNMAGNKIKYAYLFGSYARGESGPDSDIDIAVDVQAGADLLDLIGFKQAIEDMLGVEVDVTTRRSITPRLKPYIESDMVAI